MLRLSGVQCPAPFKNWIIFCVETQDEASVAYTASNCLTISTSNALPMFCSKLASATLFVNSPYHPEYHGRAVVCTRAEWDDICDAVREYNNSLPGNFLPAAPMVAE